MCLGWGGAIMAEPDLVMDGSEELQNAVLEDVLLKIKQTQPDVDERKRVLKKRRDFWEGKQNLYTNVVGIRGKEKEGHISAVFNYVWKMGDKLQSSLANFPFRIKMISEDEADEQENVRTEAVEKAINRVLSDNDFFEVIFDRCSTMQVRDGDFALKCSVQKNTKEGTYIRIEHAENMEKVYVMWDSASGDSFSGIAFVDEWTLDKIRREFDGYEAEPMGQSSEDSTAGSGSSHGDEYGLLGSASRSQAVSTGKTDLQKARVIDYWGIRMIDKEQKVINAILVNRDLVQLQITEYKEIPWYIGHSFSNPPYPWSLSFVDPLVDPQVELNDRQSEEGDMIRVGAHIKFLAINMPDFDEKSVKPGTGQVIFIEGEDADFKPLNINVSPFPSEAYLTRTMEHLFTLGLPKIAFAAGTAPYTGRVGAIQYQSVIDPVNKLRTKWEKVLKDLVRMIQQYFIDFFPETHTFMEGPDGNLIIRQVEFDWENILPLSKSDMIVDASTLFDRDAIPLRKYLELAGLNDAPRIIKELKTESRDEELLTARGKFKELSRAAVTATIDARKQQMAAEEAQGAAAGQIAAATAPTGTPEQPKPIQHTFQNQGERRGISSARGVPQTGQVSQTGAVRAVQQQTNAAG